MSSFIETLQKKSFFPCMAPNDDLPISRDLPKNTIGLRHRISSFSVKNQPLSSAASTAFAFRRSQSMPSIRELAGGPLRRWWDCGWHWILSRKLAFPRDIEMNDEQTAMLGCHSKGSLRHLFYKVRAELRKLVRGETLPTAQGFRYDSFSYAKNFDDGRKAED